MYKNIEIIAEVKTKSPFGYKSKNTWDELFKVANDVGDIISIHTDDRWGGSFDLIKKARSLTTKKILAKGIHEKDDDIQKAIEAGADFVLVVDRIPKIYQEKCLIEPFSLKELKNIPEEMKVVWNSRDLSNGKLKKESFEKARALFKGWICQASNIKTLNDVDPKANAVLVGTHLLDFAKFLVIHRGILCNVT